MQYINCTNTHNTVNTEQEVLLLININYRDARPIYEQVKDGFRQLILSGALPSDYKMPSVRDLASSLTINPNTIQRAYRELESEGYIVSVPGKGSFVCEPGSAADSRIAELKEKLREQAEELRALGLNESELMEIVRGEVKND